MPVSSDHPLLGGPKGVPRNPCALAPLRADRAAEHLWNRLPLRSAISDQRSAISDQRSAIVEHRLQRWGIKDAVEPGVDLLA